MTVSTAISRDDYTGNGILTTFPYTFRIFADADLNVYVAGVLKTLTTDYTVTGAGNTGGGNVVFVSAPTGAVAIVRNVTAKQDVDLVENDPFSAETVEAALDRAEMVCQQLQEIIGRTLAVATSSTQKNLVVDDLVAGKFLQVKTPASAGLQMVDITATGSIGVPVSIAQGGTGQITALAALNALGMPTTVLLKGSGSGNYTTGSTGYQDVDGTNLKRSVLIPVGWKLLVLSGGGILQSTAIASVWVGIKDDIASALPIVEVEIFPPATGQSVPFSTQPWEINGDGLTHAISLQFKTQNGLDSVTIVNNSATFVPTMLLVLMPSN